MNIPPIVRWGEMKFRPQEKYVSPSYRQCLLEQYCGKNQGSSSVAEYMTWFNELTIRCDLAEDLGLTLARFKNGLRSNIWRALSVYTIDSLDKTFQRALEIEQDLKSHLR